MIALIAVPALLLVVILYLYFGRNKKYDVFSKMPGPKPVPILGNINQINLPREERMSMLWKWRMEHGQLYRIWLGPFIPTVMVAKAEIVEIILRDTVHMNKSIIYDFITPWLGTGLLTSTGSKWFSHRKMLTPSFHFQILENFVGVFNNNAKILVAKLKEKKSGKVVDIYPRITLCALDIICESSMGVKVNAQIKEKSKYVLSVFTLINYTVHRFVKIWLHSDFIFKLTHYGKTFYTSLEYLHKFTRNVITNRKKSRLEDKEDEEEENYNISASEKEEDINQNEEVEFGRKKKKAFLDMLLDASETQSVPLTDEEIREEVDTFMFEGHDTTTAALCWSMFLLGHHPEIQEKAYEEQKAIFGDEMDRPVTSKDMAEMKYLERIIKEALRMYPSVPLIARNLANDTDLGGYIIPKGCQIVIDILNLHYDPQVFPNPQEFDPDRFLPENIKDKHPYAYVPFSAGPRNCIGQKFAIMEEKTVLSYLIRNFRFESVEAPKDVKLVYEVILKPAFGTKMKLYQRD